VGLDQGGAGARHVQLAEGDGVGAHVPVHQGEQLRHHGRPLGDAVGELRGAPGEDVPVHRATFAFVGD